MIERVDVIRLEPPQQRHDQHQHRDIAGNQQQVLEPAAVIRLVAVTPAFLGEEVNDEFLELADID